MADESRELENFEGGFIFIDTREITSKLFQWNYYRSENFNVDVQNLHSFPMNGVIEYFNGAVIIDWIGNPAVCILFTARVDMISQK